MRSETEDYTSRHVDETARPEAAHRCEDCYAGQFHWIDAIAVDSKGNVYEGEVEDGKRIQKFVPVTR
jgi:hypothetical protein